MMAVGLKDDMQQLHGEIKNADAIIIGSPVYMHTLNAQTKAFIDRLYPYLNPDFTSKVHKNTVLVISQGQPAPDMFKANFEWAKNSLGLLGFPVKEMLIHGNGIDKEAAAARTDIMSKAKQIGAELVSSAT